MDADAILDRREGIEEFQFQQDLGLGSWTFDNVYFYVYEEAVKLDPAGHDLASRISEHDYLAPLLAAAGVESRQ